MVSHSAPRPMREACGLEVLWDGLVPWRAKIYGLIPLVHLGKWGFADEAVDRRSALLG